MSFHMLHFLQLFFQPMKMDIFNFDLTTFLRHLQWWNLSFFIRIYRSLLARIESDIAAKKLLILLQFSYTYGSWNPFEKKENPCKCKK